MNQRSFPGPSTSILPAFADSNKRARGANITPSILPLPLPLELVLPHSLLFRCRILSRSRRTSSMSAASSAWAPLRSSCSLKARSCSKWYSSVHRRHIPVCRLIFTPTAPHCGHTVCKASEQLIRLVRISTTRTKWRTPRPRSSPRAGRRPAPPSISSSRPPLSASHVRVPAAIAITTLEWGGKARRRQLKRRPSQRLNQSGSGFPCARARAPARVAASFLFPVITLRRAPWIRALTSRYDCLKLRLNMARRLESR